MNETNGEKSGIRSLGELPRDIAPPRDLWPSIAAQLDTKAASSQPEGVSRRSWLRPTTMQWAGLAAVVSALAVGMWLGRSVLPSSGEQVPPAVASTNSPSPQPQAPSMTSAVEGTQVFTSTYVIDPRYVMHREAMVRDLDAKLNALPTESREKVAASLTAINDSLKNIEAELGRDPANALLQELLVNTYRDEMRVLTAVNEASAGREL